MRNTILSCLFLYLTFSAHATSELKDADIKGEWKGAYIVNANVIPFNVYLRNIDNKLTALVDYPSQNRFNVEFDVRYSNDSFELSKTMKDGTVMKFEGNKIDNLITGSFKYISDKMKSNPGSFQLMKSMAKHIKGDKIPAYDLVSFENKPLNNNSFKGKFILLDFWATWCGPCVKKRPKLEAIQKKFGNKIEIISISLDREISTVQTFRKVKYPMNWNHVTRPDMSKDPLVKEFIPQGLPYGYIISPDGKILATGDELSSENLEDTANRLLGR